jgi:polysaccharide chain length determinant protein (PEP-CTERM system associated)
MDNKQRQLIKKYVDLIIAKWQLIALCLLIAVIAGLGHYLRLPKLYQSTSSLSYEQQQISPARMAPDQGRTRLQDTLATLGEQVTSRNSLERVILQFSLYEEDRQRLPIEDVIRIMRDNITISPSNRGDVFSVSFQGRDPQQVMRVTNALAALFIEENLKYREERATETSRYTQSELAMAKRVLDEKEQVMRDYKLEYYNEMPEQRASNLARLTALNTQSQGIQESIQDLERTKVMLQEQMAMHQRLAAATRITGEALATGGQSSERAPLTDGERLHQLQRHLNSLLVRYTDKHPEVRRTQQLIEQLEVQAGREVIAGQQTTAPAASSSSLAVNVEMQRLQLQLREIDLNIQQLRNAQARIPAEVIKYERWIETAPIREAEWSALTRDYNELRRNYDHLVSQNLQAQSAEYLERSQKGSSFKIVNSANLPSKPFNPNFLKIIFVAIAAGCVMSFGFVLMLDLVDTSFKDAGEIEDYLGVPVVCGIAYIEMESEIRRRRRLFIASAAFFSTCGVLLLATVVYLWKQGMIIV